MEEDIAFFGKEVIFQRVGWVLMFLVLALGSLGVFGTGTLSIRTIRAGDAAVEYERFLRFENETELILRLYDAPQNSIVSLPLEYMKYFQVQHMMPEPQSMTAENGNMRYHFATGGRSEIRIFITAVKTGRVAGIVHVNNESFPVSHLIYP